MRAEVGLTGPAGALAYAVIAHWDEPANEQSVREEVLGAMREVGAALRARGDRVTGPDAPRVHLRLHVLPRFTCVCMRSVPFSRRVGVQTPVNRVRTCRRR